MLDKYTVLKNHFGYDSFRDGQEALIDSCLSHRDTLGVMPTGAGKSICFQVPAVMMEGITLVISPLISLMKDQVYALSQAGIRSAYLNSSLSAKHYQMALEYAAEGKFKIIYVAPERLESEDFLSFARSANISMLTVDEAHCISQWGQDFRPSYLRITQFIDSLPVRPVVSAFTATATGRVREDIVRSLRMDNPHVAVLGFDRSNLYFEVRKPKNKTAELLEFLKDKADRVGIVYCATRKAVDEVCDVLNAEGYSAARYHAGLSDKERRECQEDFIFDRKNIIVATNAFGMGIDKSNVSYVVHYNMPRDIESYYQEAGRAGRDGAPADCVLFYSGQDLRTQLYLIDHSKSEDYEDERAEQIAKERDRTRLYKMKDYCDTPECLRGYILRYFGENSQGGCDNCGNCLSASEEVDITVQAKKILTCVSRTRGSYGIGLVTDVLRGSRADRIMKLGLDELPVYGSMIEDASQIREMIQCMIAQELLFVTQDVYPLLRLGERVAEARREDFKLVMRRAQEQSITQSAGSSSRNRAAKRRISGVADSGLMAHLRRVRLELANEQGVPAFVIFSDSTLTEMALKKPETREEFLDVSGVGMQKLERYGDAFLAAIRQYALDPDGIDRAGAADESSKSARAEQPVPDEQTTITMIADAINVGRIQRGVTKISAQRITKWLIEEGFLAEFPGGKAPTTMGVVLGISSQLRNHSERGAYSVNIYSDKAREYIIEKLSAEAE